MSPARPRAARSLLFPSWILFCAFLVGCASSRMSDRESDRLFRDGKYLEAASRLKKGLEDKGGDEGVDSLLYLVDLGLSLHSGGQLEESNRAFLRADSIAEIKDYTSIGAEAATLLVSENIQQYKGEDFEKVLINTYLAMNFAMMGNIEAALIEARKVNTKLYRMVTEGKRKYKQNAFARYLSGILYEAERNPNDAYIDYKKTRELVPDFPGLGESLWRCAKWLGIREDMEKWEREYSLDGDSKKSALRVGPGSRSAEVIVLYENGISPRKVPHPQFNSIPVFRPRPNPVPAARVRVDQREVGQTAKLHDIEETAIANLDEKYAGIIAKKVAGAAGKGLVGVGVARATGSNELGRLVTAILLAADSADLRSWNLLPRDLQLLRVPVDEGLHEIELHPVGQSPLPKKTIQVRSGQKVFVSFRYMP